MLRLNIIGAGHVGRALGRVLRATDGVQVQDVLTRSLSSAQQAVAFIGAGQACSVVAQLRVADLTMLAVGDDQIAPLCAALSAHGGLAGGTLFHCSGALTASQLQAASQAGAWVASVHPIRSFADPALVAADFNGTFCGIEGDAAALALLEPLLLKAGARPIRIDAAAKSVYHAAAVFASNYLVTLLDTALRAYQAAGIPFDVAQELAAPLVHETVANVMRLGAAQALSGPLARGDYDTVERQQRAVAHWDAQAGELYQALVAPTLALARRKLK